MGKFEDINNLLDLVDKITSDNDPDVEVEIKVEEENSKAAKLEKARLEAKAARERVIKEEGEDRANKLLDYAMASTCITACLDIGIPLKPEMVEKYNTLNREIYPERSNEFMLDIAYSMIEMTMAKGAAAIE